MVGKCSDGEVDHDGDIVSPSWMAEAVKSWLATYPAVRMAHRADHPAGRGLEAWQDADGSTWLRSLIVDGQAKKLVRKGVLTAYSVGIAEPQQRKSSRCPRWEIVGGRLVEVSVVDSPSNARCGITVAKGSRYVGKAFKGGKPPGVADPVADHAAACLEFRDPLLRLRAEAYLAGGYG